VDSCVSDRLSKRAADDISLSKRAADDISSLLSS
jgi:hypothetical protein